ncbi:MAG: hypothetical protein LBH59_03640 [Planctomycetaceae bacterium]|nr:hypothetical protein [Planctomycetaceae bacterium]
MFKGEAYRPYRLRYNIYLLLLLGCGFVKFLIFYLTLNLKAGSNEAGNI